MARVAKIPNHFRKAGHSVFAKTGSLKCADWLHFTTTGILYVLQPLVNGKAEKALVALVRALRLLLNATSDRDPFVVDQPEEDFERRKRDCQDLKLEIVKLLCVYEDGAAISELPPVLHTLLHVPDNIFRWNSVRNMWCFFNERHDQLPASISELLLLLLVGY